MKGVNKLVVEVRPECEYFEKAILFIRPEKQDTPQKYISDSADEMFRNIEKIGIRKKNKSFLLISAGAAVGSAVTFLIALLTGIF